MAVPCAWHITCANEAKGRGRVRRVPMSRSPSFTDAGAKSNSSGCSCWSLCQARLKVRCGPTAC